MESDWMDEIVPRLSKSYIYKTFEEKCNNDVAGQHAIALVKDAVIYSYNRSKTIIKNMPEFTLHDAEHLFRVLKLMECVLTKKNIDTLYVPELLLLILSAFFHDIGMAPDEPTVKCWKLFWDKESENTNYLNSLEFSEFKKFCIARPTKLENIEKLKALRKYSDSDILIQNLISDYIRATHGKRSREIIEKDWNGKIKYKDTDLTVELADLCFSHSSDPMQIKNLDKKLILGDNTYACLPILATILRIADILDFDLKRTPDVLFSHLAVKNPVSLIEWSKHRSIEAWEINENIIQYHAKCTHPAIESAIHKFCDLIDQELSICNMITNEINDLDLNISRNLKVILPFKVDRTKIETKKDIFGKPVYNYRETRFELSKKQVVDLLMGTKLYGETDVALRELVQNSIDACLLRKSLEKKWGNDYKPQITIEFSTESLEKILEVSDNGIGMDQYIIDNYYSNIGSSFYISPDFYALRAETGFDFIPTSRFGIGILSCFMVADTIIVDTRKLYGPHNSSEPISLTIEGQESIFLIKDGLRKIPGTKTKLLLRKKKNPWEELNEEKFIQMVANVIPNPPFPITIKAGDKIKVIDENSFRELISTSMKNYSWKKHENLNEVEILFEDLNDGIIGSATIGILEKHGTPVDYIEVTNKEIKIEEEIFNLNKKIKISCNEIEQSSTTITIDDDRNIETDTSTRTIAKSKSRIALHGVEVGTTFFPENWRMQQNQVKISWPFPMLIIVDICGKRDIDLNSARNKLIMSDNWIKFEEDLAYIICKQLSCKLEKDYWNVLKSLWQKSDNETFLRGLNKVND